MSVVGADLEEENSSFQEGHKTLILSLCFFYGAKTLICGGKDISAGLVGEHSLSWGKTRKGERIFSGRGTELKIAASMNKIIPLRSRDLVYA